MAEVDLSEFMSVTTRDCKAQRLIAQLSADQTEKVVAALHTPRISTSAIAVMLSKWAGERVSISTVERHRKSECSCG